MPASVLRFNNVTTRVPGAKTRVDASALDQPPAGSSGRVLLIGQAQGGAPYTAVTAETVADFRGAEALRRAFVSGDLKEAGAMCFTPAKDDNITGAQEVICLKVNPDTQSTATLNNGNGASLVVTSDDYGPQTNQVNVSIAAGTSAGKKLTVNYNGVNEVQDNIGGLAFLTLQYVSPPSTGWGAITAKNTASGIAASGTRNEVGHSTDLLNPASNAIVTVLSSSAGDVGQVVTVYALVGGVATAIQLVLNGTTPVNSVALVDVTSVFGATLSAACAGTVTVRQAGPTTLFTIAPAALSSGGARAQAMFVAGAALTFVADSATTALVLFAGRNASGAVVLETKALNGSTPVVTTTTTWSQIDFIGLAAVAAARTVTFSGTVTQTLHTVQNTLRKVRDFFNALEVVISSVVYGFTAVMQTTRTTFNPALLDITPTGSPINVYSPATGSFFADLEQIVEALNNGSQYASGAIAVNAVGPPSNTSAPVYLSGGTTVAPSFSDYQNALNLAREIDCDTVVTLTSDPAVAAAVSAHVTYMAGEGQGERDAFMGVMNAGLTGLASLTEFTTQIAAINDRNVRCMAQSIDRFDSNGVRTTFPAHFAAAISAGMQAGMALGRNLDHAKPNILAFAQHSSWNPKDNAEQLLLAGALFFENKPGIPRRLVRDVTSNVGSDNLAYTDGGLNRIVNFVTREVRRDIDAFTGAAGNSSTAAAIIGRARKKLTTFVNNDQILRAFKNLALVITNDTAALVFSIAPSDPINFIPTTIYLYDAPVTG